MIRDGMLAAAEAELSFSTPHGKQIREAITCGWPAVAVLARVS
jgi:hypothetical protein